MNCIDWNEIPTGKRLIVSLYDLTGNWADPYIKAGYPVMLWDKDIEGDILEGFSRLCSNIEDAIEAGYIPYGLLTAPPCTAYSVSGAQYWPKKDQIVTYNDDNMDDELFPFDSITEAADALVKIVFELLARFDFKFWVMENPVGRIEKRNPELKAFRLMNFHPWHFGDAYTKNTILWGSFNKELQKTPVEPVFVTSKNGDRYAPINWKTGGKSSKTKSLRSATPKGFAAAFFQANQ